MHEAVSLLLLGWVGSRERRGVWAAVRWDPNFSRNSPPQHTHTPTLGSYGFCVSDTQITKSIDLSWFVSICKMALQHSGVITFGRGPWVNDRLIPLIPTGGLTHWGQQNQEQLCPVIAKRCSWRVQASLPFETPCMKHAIINLTAFHL